MPTYPFGTHVAVVEVDTETGHVRLRRHVAVDDAGTLINPLLAEGQIHGGIAQGVAQALLEDVHYDDDGQPRTTNFADYPVIGAVELPSFELVPMETPTFANELGAKGVGESGTIGAIPSVYNAVIDALAHLGVRHLETPLTPERVWRAVRAARQAGADAAGSAATVSHLRLTRRRGQSWVAGCDSTLAGDGAKGALMSTPATRASGGASINHLVLNVRDIEASHRFYTELIGFEQCGDLTHTMTMRFYRGDSSRHHDFALVQVDESRRTGSRRTAGRCARRASASTTSPSPTPTARRGSTSCAT